MSFATPASGVRGPAPHAHIVDVLITERAPNLAGSRVWPLLRPLLGLLLRPLLGLLLGLLLRLRW